MTDCQLLFFQKRIVINLIEKTPQLSINMIVSLPILERFASLIESSR